MASLLLLARFLRRVRFHTVEVSPEVIPVTRRDLLALDRVFRRAHLRGIDLSEVALGATAIVGDHRLSEGALAVPFLRLHSLFVARALRALRFAEEFPGRSAARCEAALPSSEAPTEPRS